MNKFKKNQEAVTRDINSIYSRGKVSPKYENTYARGIYTYLMIMNDEELRQTVNEKELPVELCKLLKNNKIQLTKVTSDLEVGKLYFISYLSKEFKPLLAEYIGVSKHGSLLFSYVRPFYREGMQIYLNKCEANVYRVQVN